MTTLQIQHYGIYPWVGREGFARYVQANNRAALLPTILPAIVLLLTSLILMLERPHFMSFSEAALVSALNIVQLASTMVWQRRLHAQMARSGYDEAKVKLLLSTNLIRTLAFLVQAVVAAVIFVRALASS